MSIIWMVIWGMGCSTTTTHLSSPYALKPKQVELTGAYAWQINSVVIDKSLDSAQVLYEQATEEERTMTEEEFLGLMDTTLAWSLMTPGSSYELIGRVGITDKLLEGIDIGFKTDFTALKADIKWQLWESKTGNQALAWTGAYAWHSNLVNPQVAWATNSTFSRQDFDTALMFGARKEGIAEIYGGPRMIYSFINAEPNLSSQMSELIPEQFKALDPSEYFTDERMIYYGGTIGTRLGYYAAFVTLELNCFWLMFEPQVINQNRPLNGLLISPTAAITIVPGEYKNMQRKLEQQWERQF